MGPSASNNFGKINTSLNINDRGMKIIKLLSRGKENKLEENACFAFTGKRWKTHGVSVPYLPRLSKLKINLS